MDLLKTILVYMSMVVAASVQNAPDPGAMPAYDEPTPTPYVQAAPTPAPTPTATPKPTPVPTIDITPNPEYSTLQVGDKGDEVRRLQEELARYGYYEGDIDGVYGNQTRRAVEQFQYQHGLSSDGMAGRVTLTVLYESNQVRMSPSAVTPAPSATSGLSVALTETPASATPAAATDTPQPSATPAVTATATPAAATATPAAPTATPSPTVAPTSTPEPSFEAMTGYGIRLSNAAEALTVTAEDEEEAPLLPCRKGEEVYLPLIEILHAAGINVIASESVEADEYAFAVNDDIIRIAFTHDQSGAPVSLEAYKNNEAQIVPVRDIRSMGDVLYLPASTIQSLTGIAAQVDEASQTVTVTLPAAPEEGE
ncbi:MAG: peptidoglycan-binding protein [Clostridiales bacterium]|nr:peptidoglycan-binding protein [Clostridiales bacterium]